MLLALLKVPKLQVNGFMSAEPTSKEHRQQCAVRFALQIVDGSGVPESLGLFGRKPVAESDPELLYALDASYPGREIRTE
jgi:phenylacetate-coenzyme A ligase PaaK-like adenylate-forming protein